MGRDKSPEAHRTRHTDRVGPVQVSVLPLGNTQVRDDIRDFTSVVLGFAPGTGILSD